MMDAQLPADFALLSLCAILQAFDHDLLLALGDCAAQEVATLLSSDLVVPAAETPGAYRLREEIAADVRVRLREEHPQAEIALHTRAFEYFIARMQPTKPGERNVGDEQSCFYHLGELRELLTEHREWQTIARHIATARAAGPQQSPHLDLLALHEGYVAVRTLDYSRGEAILTVLLDRPDLDDDVRIRVLHALGVSYTLQARYDLALA